MFLARGYISVKIQLFVIDTILSQHKNPELSIFYWRGKKPLKRLLNKNIESHRTSSMCVHDVWSIFKYYLIITYFRATLISQIRQVTVFQGD